MPLKQRQHMQPAAMHFIMQSQQAWIMSQQALSPDVQVMVQPVLVISQVHLHMAMLHEHIIKPFIMQQHDIMPSHIILHMFCMVMQATSSSQVHMIFMPPAHFSIFMVQRGTMHMPMPVFGIDMVEGMPPIIGAEAPIMPMPLIIERSIIIMPEFITLS